MDDEIIESEGWKGKSGVDIIESQSKIVILRCYKKHKESGERYHTDHKISKESIENLLNIITKNCEPRTEYGPKFLWRKIVEHYKIDKLEPFDKETLIELFNGGKLRAKYYFPLYYYPMKYLEEKGEIYFGERSWMWLG